MSNNDWTQIDWSDLYPRLLLFTASKLKRLHWRGRRSGPVPGAKTAKDFVQEAILKTISGERRWNRSYSLFEHLIGVISSEISHLVESMDNRRTLQADENIILIEDHRESPESVAARKSQERRFFDYLDTKNPQLTRLAQAILYDPVRSVAELAADLGLPIDAIDNLKRALRRATDEFLDREEPPEPSSPVKKGVAYGS